MKYSFVSNFWSWVKPCIDEGPTSLINFFDWLDSRWGRVCFLNPSLFCFLPLGAYCILPVCFGLAIRRPLLINIYYAFADKKKRVSRGSCTPSSRKICHLRGKKIQVKNHLKSNLYNVRYLISFDLHRFHNLYSLILGSGCSVSSLIFYSSHLIWAQETWCSMLMIYSVKIGQLESIPDAWFQEEYQLVACSWRCMEYESGYYLISF